MLPSIAAGDAGIPAPAHSTTTDSTSQRHAGAWFVAPSRAPVAPRFRAAKVRRSRVLLRSRDCKGGHVVSEPRPSGGAALSYGAATARSGRVVSEPRPGLRLSQSHFFFFGFAYSTMPWKSRNTAGSFPSFHPSCPGGMWTTSPAFEVNSVPSSIRVFSVPESR